jgi:hypothetical protein
MRDKEAMMRKQWMVVACLLVIAVAAIGDGIHIILKYQNKIGAREAGGYLMLLGSLLACLSIAFWSQVRKTRTTGSWRAPEGIQRIPKALALLAGYAIFWDFLGYLLSTALFLILYLRMFGSYRWVPVLMGSVIAAAGSAYFWTSVGLMLPEGILPWP